MSDTTFEGSVAATGGFVGVVTSPITSFSADGAITIKQGIARLTKGTAGAYTLAAPTAGTDDGKELIIIAGTAAAHTVTQATPGFNGAGTGADVATFGGAKGDNLRLMAVNGEWLVLTLRNVTLA